MAKRQQMWEKLEEEMAEKRKRGPNFPKGKKIKAPHELIVQRLASEADHKQVYKPVQPRDFVMFEYEELTLVNLKKACAKHFNLLASTCDVLVSNKGPSCSNITQIPYRKDKVYLIRFVVGQEDSNDYTEDDSQERQLETVDSSKSVNKQMMPVGKKNRNTQAETTYPASVSIADLINAGRLVRPKVKKEINVKCEYFDVESNEWGDPVEILLSVDNEKFSSGAFRDAYHASVVNGNKLFRNQKLVLKKYRETANKIITTVTKSSTEDHCRKQVQMHAVARHVAKVFAMKAPVAFGECFNFKKCYYIHVDGHPATLEEYVPGTFKKYINNDGSFTASKTESKEIIEKAECLSHYSYVLSERKMMLLDLQGSGYNLYDPEVATYDLESDSGELYFCCGNCTSVGIDHFLANHTCATHCAMMKIANAHPI